MMPQKRNPDGLELARGKAARLAGDVAAALALLKGLPSGYQKDIQEDKALLFGAFDAILLVLPVVRETVSGMRFDASRIAGALDSATLATDLADALVRRGVPFREAHGVVGKLVRRAEEKGVAFDALSAADRAEAHPLLAGLDAPSADASVEARDLPGGPARAAVLEQLRLAGAALG